MVSIYVFTQKGLYLSVTDSFAFEVSLEPFFPVPEHETIMLEQIKEIKHNIGKIFFIFSF